MNAPATDPTFDGAAPDTCPVALLLIDVINDFEYPGADQLFVQAMPMAPRLAALRRAAKEHGIPVLYVNDNFGRWQADLDKLVDHCLHDKVRGKPFVEQLLPEPDDYFVLKPKNSGFYSTVLEALLAHLGARTLILTGLTGDNCVFFTAADAYMRDFKLVVPSDCTVSIDPDDNARMLAYMRETLKADSTPSADLDLDALQRN